jgi:hypothetical protein
MEPRKKRRVYIMLTAVVIALFAAGALYGYTGRKTPICPNGKAPVAQQADDMGQVTFLCTNGITVTN